MRKYGDILIILNMGSEGLVYPIQMLNFYSKKEEKISAT